MVLVTTSGAGLVLDAHPENFRWVYGAGALLGGLGVWSFGAVSVVGEQRHRVLERRSVLDGSGHNDFAPRERLSAYMAVHVTLTGVRGAFAPFLGMAQYLGWDAKGYVPGSSGLGAWLFLVSALLGVVAWRGFDVLRREIGE